MSQPQQAAQAPGQRPAAVDVEAVTPRHASGPDAAAAGTSGSSGSSAAPGAAGSSAAGGWNQGAPAKPVTNGQAPNATPAEARTTTIPAVPPPPRYSGPPVNPGNPDHHAVSPPPDRQRAARARGPRRARLQLRHIDSWTVLKFACVLSIALFFVWLIVVGVLYGVLDGTGVIAKINDSVTTLNGGTGKAPVTPGIVFGGAAIIGVVNIVLFIAVTTIGSVVYNLCADLVGGIEVTLSES